MAKKLIRKSPSKSDKSNKSKKSKNHNTKNLKSSRRSRVHKMHGGDTGRYVLPPSYFGRGTDGYVENPSAGKKLAVSQGIIHADGRFAGPDLYPGQVGSGSCCNSRKLKNRKSMSNRKSKTMKRTKKH